MATTEWSNPLIQRTISPSSQQHSAAVALVGDLGATQCMIACWAPARAQRKCARDGRHGCFGSKLPPSLTWFGGSF
jgi:hypothetical protein